MKDFMKTVFASALGYILGSIFFTVLSMILFVAVVAAMMAYNRSEEFSSESMQDKSILFINVEGTIAERRTTRDVIREMLVEEAPKEIGLLEMRESLKEAAKDKRVSGIYLRLRWVNAGWAKLESFRKMLKEFKKSGKFIYAYSEAYDEKLYYLASVADEILMYPKGEFEWNGIFIKSMFFKKTLAKLEVEPTLIRAGKFKSAGEVVTEEKMSEENRYQLNELTTSLWNTILKEISEDRKDLSESQLNLWASQLTVTNAQEAFNEKLVTELIPIEEVEKKLMSASGVKDEEPRLVSWPFYHETVAAPALKKRKNKIAVVLAQGEIQMGSGPNNETVYSDDMSALIRDLNEEKEVKAVVLRVDSPGGSALASDVIWRSLEYLKKNKKLVTSFSDVAASGGYYIAAGSDYIFAEPTTLTGSIGVFGLMMGTEKFFDSKLGITFDQVKTHESADMMTGRLLTPFEKQKIQASVNDIYKTFLNVVRQGRHQLKDEGAVEEIAEGRVWAGSKAVDIGLVDALGSLDNAIAKAAELSNLKDYEVVYYPYEKSFFDKLFNSLGNVSILPSWVKTMIEVVQPDPNKKSKVYTRLPFVPEF